MPVCKIGSSSLLEPSRLGRLMGALFIRGWEKTIPQNENPDDSQFTCKSSGFRVYRNQSPVMIEITGLHQYDLTKTPNFGHNKKPSRS